MIYSYLLSKNSGINWVYIRIERKYLYGKNPKVFISYSHDDTEHKLWVKELATQLRSHGVDIILDQ
ncbi:SEFIR domain-containing protein [Enterococcus gallinarum]|uniref:SEFIR domain-containing protein n=1 Tax=Enterococcus gallinarum TaxID=1353 RepID=UPI00352FF172